MGWSSDGKQDHIIRFYYYENLKRKPDQVIINDLFASYRSTEVILMGSCIRIGIHERLG